MDEVTELARAAGEGDQMALAAFVQSTQAEVWRLCAHLGGRQQADDLTQDVYLRAIRALPGFRGEASARTWLLGIARRTVADSIRAAQRRRRLQRAVPAGQATPDASAVVALEAMLATLGHERRSAFVLTQVLGLSYAEAAEVCGCALGTIRSRVARARQQLIDDLGEASAR